MQGGELDRKPGQSSRHPEKSVDEAGLGGKVGTDQEDRNPRRPTRPIGGGLERSPATAHLADQNRTKWKVRRVRGLERRVGRGQHPQPQRTHGTGHGQAGKLERRSSVEPGSALQSGRAGAAGQIYGSALLERATTCQEWQVDVLRLTRLLRIGCIRQVAGPWVWQGARTTPRSRPGAVRRRHQPGADGGLHRPDHRVQGIGHDRHPALRDAADRGEHLGLPMVARSCGPKWSGGGTGPRAPSLRGEAR